MNTLMKIVLASGMSMLAMTCSNAAELGAKDEAIKLAVNEWTGAQITTHIAGKILEAAGYKVEYVTAGYQNQWQAVSEGRRFERQTAGCPGSHMQSRASRR